MRQVIVSSPRRSRWLSSLLWLASEGKPKPCERNHASKVDRRIEIGKVSRLMAKTRQDKSDTDEIGVKRQRELYTSVAPCWRNLRRSIDAGSWNRACSLDQPVYKAFNRKEPARKSTYPYLSYTYSYRRTCCAFPLRRKAGLSSNEQSRDGVTVVVVGVTSHQGVRESRTQGEGSQIVFFKSIGTDGGDRPYE